MHWVDTVRVQESCSLCTVVPSAVWRLAKRGALLGYGMLQMLQLNIILLLEYSQKVGQSGTNEILRAGTKARLCGPFDCVGDK